MLTRNFRTGNYRTLLAAAIGVMWLLPVCVHAQMVRPEAKLVEFTGQVSILQGPGSYKALFVNDTVYAAETIITGPNSYARFVLPDHSTFDVFENAHVVFNDNWPSIGSLVDVILGRIKVFIDHSKGPNNQKVTTPTAIISVRGTFFDVDVEDADGTTLVSVDEGRVQVQATTAVSRDIYLDAGQSVRVFRNQPFGMKGTQIDKMGIVQKVMRASYDAARQVLLGRTGPSGPIGGVGSPGGGGPQGDKGGKTGSATGAPAPPPPPGGGGGGN